MPVLTVNVPELAGIPWGTPGSRIIGHVETSADAIVDAAAGTVSVGRPPLDFDETGLATLTLPATVGTYKYRVVIRYSDSGEQITWTSGYFNLTADANLADLTTTTVLNTYPTLADAISAKNSAAASAAAAAASAQTAHDISNIDTSDDVVTALVNDQGSAFHDALTAGYAGKNNVSIDINRGPYNAQPGTDITTALQQAVNDLAATGLSGEIVFTKGGNYYLNGAQQTGTVLGYTYSGQILLPAVDITHSLALTIRGAATPAHGGSGRPTNGTTIVTNATAGFAFACVPSFNQFSAPHPWTNVMPVLEDLVIQGPNDPQCGIVDALCAQTFVMRRSAICTSEQGGDFTAGYSRTGNTEAIRLPQRLNAGLVTLRDVVIRNWSKGVRVAEHAVFDQVRISTCNSAVVADDPGAHGSVMQRLNVENCLNIFEYDTATINTPLTISGHLDWEGGNGLAALVKQPKLNQIVGRLDIHHVSAAGFPLLSTSTTTGPDSRLGKLNLSSVKNGAAGWVETWPKDVFARFLTPTASLGTAYPSMHPWYVHVGSFQIVTTGGTAGALTSTNGTSQSTAFIQNAKAAGRSRRVSATFTFGTAHHARLMLNQVIGGTNASRYLGLDLLANGQVRIIGFMDGTNAQVYVTASPGLADGSTYTVSADVIVDGKGLPDLVIAYVEGAEVARYKLTAGNKAALVPSTNLADSPFVVDGIALFEQVTTVTAFEVKGSAAPPAVLANGTATLVAGTVTVANANVTANTVIRYWRTTAGGTMGQLSLALTAGTSFTINSTSSSDTSTVRYEVVSY